MSPTPTDIENKLMQILRPPIPPWMWLKHRREDDEFTKRRKPREVVGWRMVWPFRILWKENLEGRGVIKVLKEERTIGSISYLSSESRKSLVEVLESIIRQVK